MESQRWLERLRPGHPRRDRTVAELRELLVRVARHELGRRRRELNSVSGPEFHDLAQQAADDALIKILGRLHEFRELSRFTTWAYKFVMLEVSDKLARHASRRHPPSRQKLAFTGLPDSLAPRPGDRLEEQERLRGLSAAIGELTERQREVFVAVALNGVPIEVLAVQLGSNRNAIYKNLFNARRSVRASLAAAGPPLRDEIGKTRRRPRTVPGENSVRPGDADDRANGSSD